MLARHEQNLMKKKSSSQNRSYGSLSKFWGLIQGSALAIAGFFGLRI